MSSPAAIAILNFGRLLWDTHKSPAQRDEKKIEEAQEKLKWMLVSEKSQYLRAALNYNNAVGRNVEPMALRAMSLVAFTTLCSTRNAPAVPEVALAIAGDDAAKVLEARECLSGLCIRGALVLAPRTGNGLTLGQAMLDYFAGGSNAPPLVIDEHTLEAAMQHRLRPAPAAKRRTQARPSFIGNLPTAKELAAEISEIVIGLPDQVRTLSVRLALHMRRSQLILCGRDPGSPNECLMFIGPSGCGKTWLAENAGRVSGLPFASVSSGDLTAQGFVGLNLDESFLPLINAANNDLNAVRSGLIFYDEWDKRAAAANTTTIDIGGVSVQQEMLRLMEGCEVQVGGRRSGHSGRGVLTNTRGIMFLFGGAFVGLDQILEKSLAGGMGFGGPMQNTHRATALYEGLVEFGMLPEFINRLTGILVFPEPTIEQLIEIASRSVVPACNNLLATCGVQIKVTTDALELMAVSAMETKTYARGLKALLAKVTEEIVYDETEGVVQIDTSEVEQAIIHTGLGVADFTAGTWAI